jgi:hypothetical protein
MWLNTEEETIAEIEREIKAIEKELKFLRDNPKRDVQVYQAMNKSDILEQRLDSLHSQLENF